MTDIFIVPVTKPKLDSIPADVRVLFVHIGHLRNEIMMLQKLVWASQQYTTIDEIKISMRAYQSLMLTRLLSGKLNEGWILLTKSYFGTKLSQSYEQSLDTSGRESIAKLKGYFGKQGLMHEIRNKFAFHYASDKIREVLSALEEPVNLKIYISKQAGNSFYEFSETIVNTALLEGIKKGDYEAALKKWMDQVLEIARHLVSFCDAWISFVLQKYFPEITSLDKLERAMLPDLPNLSEIGLDYFISEP